jgi:hypothetical protein
VRQKQIDYLPLGARLTCTDDGTPRTSHC